MNKPKKKLTFWQSYWILAAALVLLAAAALVVFWFFMDAYEHSRPQFTIDAYLSQVTPEGISGHETAIPKACDLYLQSEESARDVIRNSLGELSCLRDPKQSTPERIVYAITNGSRRIGSVALTVKERDLFGFDHWQVSEEIFDFSHLLGDTVSVTVPTGYRVFVGGKPLGNEYLTARNIWFEQLEPYYEAYNPPTMRTYTTGQILGIPVVSVRDMNDDPAQIQTMEEIQATYCNCTGEETVAVKKAAEAFVKAHVRFSSAAGGRGYRYYNYQQLAKHMVPGGDLARRMRSALDAMYWVGDHRAKITALKHNQIIRLQTGAYMCDLTYTINQQVRGGRADSSVNLRIVLVDVDGILKAESMLIY